MARLARPAALTLLLVPAALAPRAARAGDDPCRESAEHSIWVSPQRPAAGLPLRVMAVSESAPGGELVVEAPGGEKLGGARRRGGPPFSVSAGAEHAVAGTYVARFSDGGKPLACQKIVVSPKPAARPPATPGVVWPSTLRWEMDTENLYSAWIETLFDAPAAETPGWRPLHRVLRDPQRNFLHDHLGLGEDSKGMAEVGKPGPKGAGRAPPGAIVAAPDCADMPYTLRAYFAWKVGLPSGMRDCSRDPGRPPTCTELITNETPPEGVDTVSSFNKFLRLIANKVHSGSGRTRLEDDATDYYPVKLARAALRPGAVYADPYGHTLILVKWTPQTAASGGILFAVDGQPDGSVGRKRFWEGNFLWSDDHANGDHGWKALRPIVRDAKAGAGVAAGATGAAPLRSATNAELGKDVRAPFSAEQKAMTAEAFYAQMGRLVNPSGQDPRQAYLDTLEALHEQLKVRLGSVDNGEKFMRESKNRVVDMPIGPKIFETVGPWEDYSTPSRDMRLIIALNVLAGLPDRVVKHPDLFVLGSRKPEAARDELRALHDKLTRERAIEYARSDGTKWRLTVADVLGRKKNFEVSYNPNDCAEVRWGASSGTEEYAPCQRHAPHDQRARMNDYRVWFADAKRPPR